MENAIKQREILKKLTDARNKLSALYSLFNSSIISAEEDRCNTINCIEKMLDLKNTIRLLSNELSALSKTERKAKLAASSGKMRGFRKQAGEIDKEYVGHIENYNSALVEPNQLKTDLMGEIHDLCAAFKETVDKDTSAIVKKGYNNQIKLIKKVNEGIGILKSDYTIKKNNIQANDSNFQVVKESVLALIDSLEKSA